MEYFMLVIYLTLAILVSFLCSILEAVLLSITPSYMSLQSRNDSSLGKDLKKFKDNIDEPLSAILTLNTFAHTLGAAGVGAEAQAIWGEELLTIISFVLTIVILIFSEIIPKTLGATYWRALAPFSTITIKILLLILFPFVWVSSLITKSLKGKGHGSVLSRADFSAYTELGFKQGVIKKRESEIINNLLNFENVLVKHIMTPRTAMFSVPANLSVREFYERNKDVPFSRIPIYQKNTDYIDAFVLKDELLLAIIEKKADQQISTLGRKILFVKEDLSMPQLFNILMEDNEHVALVKDQFGGTSGLVTMEDLIETLLGTEIVDESDNVADLQQLARTSWMKRTKKMEIETDNLDSGKEQDDKTD